MAERLPNTKLSIRLSILSIVLILLIGVSILIIGVNYFTLNVILVESAKNSLVQTTGRVAEQVGSYLKPLNSNIATASRMFNLGVTNPQDPDFTKFLYSLIVDDRNLVGAYWGDVHGNNYLVNRDPNGFYEEIILRNDSNRVLSATKRYLGPQGDLLSAGVVENPKFDPRTRPWYQQAEKRKGLTWVVYRFVAVGNQPAQYGVTSAFPVYDTNGKLLGVFGIDMLLGTVSDYVANIKLTDNSFIFVMNLNKGNLIAAYTEQRHLLNFDLAPDITDINIAWLRKAFELYKRKPASPFVYTLDKKNYIAAYEKIPSAKSDDPWVVAIITPVDDIVAPLLRNVLTSVVLTTLALLFGVIMASFFASSLSRPIKALAQDANLICQLQLASIKHLFSRIQEIADMADAFIKMRNALYSFQRYMPITLVKKLILSNKIAAVGGEAKELTLFFSDIRDFTQLSENFDPEKLMQYLSEYLQHVTRVIIETQGTIDKYVGDGVVAFWGAPIDDLDHTLHACRAALHVQEELKQLNIKWREEGKPEVDTRFGISCGRVVVGNVGSDDRLSYTSLGDPVNLASRLEGLNKVYGTAIMVSEFVYEKVKDKFQFRLLDRVAVKGKTHGVYVYELLGELGSTHDMLWEQYNQEFYVAFSSYEKGYWQNALHLFRELSEKYPDDQVVKIFIYRCISFIDNPPRDWNGVWIMDEK